jgi:ubiquitin C-terminal hydrolase
MVNRGYNLRFGRTIPAPTCTAAQTAKNQALTGLQKTFPIRRTNGNYQSRGLYREEFGVECYRLSALQCLLHLPRALRWILQHNEPRYDNLGTFLGADYPCAANPRHVATGVPVFNQMQHCMACAVKDVITRYWGNMHLQADGSPRPLRSDNTDIAWFHEIVDAEPRFGPVPITDDAGNQPVDEDGKDLTQNQQCDAEEFITWLLAEIRDANNTSPAWVSMYEALFQLEFEERRFCTICDNLIPRDPNPTVDPPMSFRQASVGLATMVIDCNNPATVADAINTEMAEIPNLISRQCPTCAANQLVTKRFRIDAAPEYLLLKFNPMYNSAPAPAPGAAANPAVLVKITNHNELPAISRQLDLTQYQVDTSTHLRYRLVAVLPHYGESAVSGHWIAAVRNTNGRPRCYLINDDEVNTIPAGHVLRNPQISSVDGEDGEEFQVVVLMYARIY